MNIERNVVRFKHAAPMAALLALAACGGGGGSANSAATLVIEGTVSGLLGSGLVVQNNAAADQTIPGGAGGFVFTGIRENAAYSISVKTQPTSPSQTCTVVSNGAGTIRSDPIRNVAITCVTNSFAVGGSINGLTGAGLTLSLNGGAAQAISAGTAVVAFPPIASGTPYTVTIGAQPSGQTCSVNNGAGTVGAAAVTAVTVSCTNGTGFTIGGNVTALSSGGLTLSLNGATPVSLAAGISAFTLPTLLPTGAAYSVTVTSPASAPLKTCLLSNAKGRVAASNVTNMKVWCFPNGGIDSYTGTFAVNINGRRNYLTLWFDGTYSLASRIDDATCTNSGNGIEYGVYRRATDGTFSISFAHDSNGDCGLWSPAATPTVGALGTGFTGTMVRNGNTLTLTSPAASTITAEAVESVPTSLVGAFTRADGIDGSFIVFESDGTYLYQETQAGGYERGCYAISGSTFTTSLAASCSPNGLPALDLNGINGFSGSNGAPIPFTIPSATSVTIDGVLYNRIAPAG